MNKFKHGSLLIIAALGLSACSVSVTDENNLSRTEVRRIVCDMVDNGAMNDEDRCDRLERRYHD